MSTYQEFCGVGDQCEKSNTEELFVNVHALQDNINRVDKDLSDNCIEECCSKKNDRTLGFAPIGCIMSSTGLGSLDIQTNILKLFSRGTRLFCCCTASLSVGRTLSRGLAASSCI